MLKYYIFLVATNVQMANIFPCNWVVLFLLVALFFRFHFQNIRNKDKNAHHTLFVVSRTWSWNQKTFCLFNPIALCVVSHLAVPVSAEVDMHGWFLLVCFVVLLNLTSWGIPLKIHEGSIWAVVELIMHGHNTKRR